VILVNEIEDAVLTNIFGAVYGVPNFILSQIAPVLREEIEVRARRAARSGPAAGIEIDFAGVGGDDVEDAILRFRALRETFQKSNHKNAAMFADQILSLLEKNKAYH
jgi:hypothetical protein